MFDRGDERRHRPVAGDRSEVRRDTTRKTEIFQGWLWWVRDAHSTLHTHATV